MRAVWKQALRDVNAPKRFLLACAIGILLAGPYPSDLSTYNQPANPELWSATEFVDRYARFINVFAQLSLPILSRDPIGLVQACYVALGTTVATQGLKRLVDHWSVGGTRLGERPSGGNRNMPSGHSSMASSAAYFVSRRYGFKHLIYLGPLVLLTMFARVELNAHTVSAVIAGALVGILMAALFTSPRKGSMGPSHAG